VDGQVDRHDTELGNREATPEELLAATTAPVKIPVEMKHAEAKLGQAKLTRRESPQVDIKQPPQCPDVARSTRIAQNVCVRLGHSIITFHARFYDPNTQKMVDSDSFMCSHCGFMLNEIRGQ
jgi:hypothetical protein